MNFKPVNLSKLFFAKQKIFWLLLLFCGLNLFSVVPEAIARQPTPAELEAIRKETKLVFQNFLQLWQEERYFELYKYGKKQSKEQIAIEEFATRMVELNWVPVGLVVFAVHKAAIFFAAQGRWEMAFRFTANDPLSFLFSS